MKDMGEMFYEEDSSEDESIDIKRYTRVLLNRKWLILIIVVVISIPWLIYLNNLPPSYEAFCIIRFRNLELVDSENMISRSRIDELKSRSFAEKVVAQLGLTLNMEKEDVNVKRSNFFEEFFTTTNPISGDYVFQYQDDGIYKIYRIVEDREILIDEGALAQAVMKLRDTDAGFTFRLSPDFSNLPKEINFKIEEFRKTVESFRKRTDVSVAGDNLLKLTMTDYDAVLVAQMVNRLAEIYVNESRSLKKKSVEEKKTILTKRLAFIKEDLDRSKEELQRFKSTHLVNLDTETRTLFDEKNKADIELKESFSSRDALQELINKIDSYSSSEEKQQDLKFIYRQLTALPTFEKNQKMGFLKQQLADIEKRYEDTVNMYTENHEKAIQLRQDIVDIQLKINNEVKLHLENLKKKIDRLSGKINTLDYKLKTQLPADEMKLAELEGKYKSNEELYNSVQAQLQLVEITDVAETEEVDILDPALVPEYPVNRDKRKKATMGVIFSFVLGIGVALGIEFLDNSIKTVDDIKKYLKIDVIGTIPNINFKDIHDYQDSEKIKQIDQQLVTYDYSPTPIGEAYRSLRTNLVFSKSTGRIHSLVITSSAPGDGKSFTAANVAIAMAQHKSNTLLIDADLRRGVLHNTYGIPKEPGLTNYLTNMVSFQHLVNETLIPNLSIISCGSLLPNPSELLGSHQMQRFLDEAKRKFDIVIFDSPPLNAATDAIVIGTQVDAVVLVIRAGVTDRNVAKQKLEMFKNIPVRILGAVLNGTTAEFGHDGYSYYHY